MGSISNYLENASLDHIFGTAALTQPSTYLALGTGADDTGLTTEVTGNNYARVAVSTAGGWEAGAAGTNRSTQNTGTITFNQASGSWGTPDSWAIYDALSGGNPLAWGSITTPKLISHGMLPFPIMVGVIILLIHSSTMFSQQLPIPQKPFMLDLEQHL